MIRVQLLPLLVLTSHLRKALTLAEIFMKHFKTMLLFILLFLQSCNLTKDDIEEQSWKYSEGFSIGDWIQFNNSAFSLSNDTVYINGQPAAKIISSKINIFGSKRSITIESFQKKEKGIYIEK